MQVVPLQSSATSIQDFTAVATASSFSLTNVPSNAIDNNGATYWESSVSDVNQPGGGPYLQIDLTRILKVYGIVVVFDSTGFGKPPNFTLQTTDNPTDQAYGSWQAS